jgi:hypothetical protein
MPDRCQDLSLSPIGLALDDFSGAGANEVLQAGVECELFGAVEDAVLRLAPMVPVFPSGDHQPGG